MVAGNIRALPAYEKPPASPVDFYFVFAGQIGVARCCYINGAATEINVYEFSNAIAIRVGICYNITATVAALGRTSGR